MASAKIANLYAMATPTDRWYMHRVFGLLVLEDICQLPDCYSQAPRKNTGKWPEAGVSALTIYPASSSP